MIGKPVYISFQGVESAFYIWLNGEFVGYSEDSFTPAEFDLSPYIREGENKLAVEVYQRSTGGWLEDQDFWRMSGIFRDVYLYTVPKVHVWDLRVKADLDDAYEEGLLEIDLALRADHAESVRAKLELKDAKGKAILTETGEFETASCPSTSQRELFSHGALKIHICMLLVSRFTMRAEIWPKPLCRRRASAVLK